MTKSYSQPNTIKIITDFGLVFFNSILFYFFISIYVWEYNLYQKVFYLVSCFSFWLTLNIGFLDQLLEKVTISEDIISLRTLFRKKSLLINEIKGYKIKNKNVFLIPFDKKKCGISFSKSLVGEEKIIDYFISNKHKI